MQSPRGIEARPRSPSSATRNEAIEQSLLPEHRSDSVRSYADAWIEKHPRSERTNETNRHRLGLLLEVEIDGAPFGDMLLADVSRRHVKLRIDHMLRVQGRAITGVRGICSVYSAMFNDAIEDELCENNPFTKLKLRKTDPRIKKQPVKKRVWTYPDMHAFAHAAGLWHRQDGLGLRREAMVRVLSDCGLRLGEMLGLRVENIDGDVLHVRGNAHEGRITEVQGDTKLHHRDVPIPPSLAEGLAIVVEHTDSDLLFPSLRGKVWRESNFYRDVWGHAKEISGLDIEPHEMRHSYLSTLSASGIDPADLAEVAGHTVETLLNTYTHALGQSADKIRKVIG
jgi:integrase